MLNHTSPGELQRASIDLDHRSVYVDSYYAASANRGPLRPPLSGEDSCDVCVIGGGYTGLSTALALAEKSYSVCLVEAFAIGWGASGRNGGQIVNGLNASLGMIERQFGRDAADFVGPMLQEGASIICDRIAKYKIDCNYRRGNIYVAYTQRHLSKLREKMIHWNRYGMDDHELLNFQELQAHVRSQAYVGGMIDHSGGHVHPLNLALGEANAFEGLGGRIFECTPAMRFERRQSGYSVVTKNGKINCRSVALCGNAYLAGVAPELERRILPVSTQMVATQSLGEEHARTLLPTNMCVEDTRYILDYYRFSADWRLLFGGGVVYGGKRPKDISARLLPNIRAIFPSLKKARIDYAWSGNFALSFTRVPQLGRLDEGVYFAHGYSGHGVTGSHLFGQILAQAIHGDSSQFDVFETFPYRTFPGGRTLRVPYSVLGSWWYSLRDRLGV